MKRFLCIMLSALLFCNTTVVCADDLHGGSSGSIDVTPTPIVLPDNSAGMISELMVRLIRPDVAGAVDTFQTWWDKWIGERWKTNADMLNDVSLSSDGSTVHLHKQFVDDVNQAVQDKVHALDGFYLLEPANTFDYKKDWADKMTAKDLAAYNQLDKVFTLYYSSFEIEFLSSCDYLYLDGTDSFSLYRYDDSLKKFKQEQFRCFNFVRSTPYVTTDYLITTGVSLNTVLNWFNSTVIPRSYGVPLKVFYSKSALQKYLDNDKKRTYAPQLPSTTISIPIKYINNSVSLPDITYNINTTNKTEVEIQNEYNTTLNNYLDDLNKFSDGGSGNNPTPTPSGGGSGDFGDGTTPTPKPDFGDGSDLTDTNDWLKKIYEWLQSFGDTHSKFEKTITDYIEANDGKLDQIIEAINALSDGKTEDEKNGCKYDFTALSDFMTNLWNESDKKFDKMVELLEENNKYQKKLVNSLNEIKSILVTQTIMDVFQDRSQQTAEKAKNKFPTSLPWDIALVVNAMSAEPEKPQFNLPIQIKSLNINEEIHVDLASGEWEKLAKTCRYLLSILFILLMIQLSRKLFSNGGDD